MAEYSLEQLTFQNGEITLGAVAAGPKNGDVILLLHGFPEFWFAWRKQIGPLSAAGFRVVAPDGRGYNRSSKPLAVEEYSMDRLVADVLCIIQQLGCESVYLVGHDWGALVAWSVAALHPEKVKHLVILNVPHPAAMRRFLLTQPLQLLRSWYVFFFQIPRLPEALFSAADYKTGVSALTRSSRPGTFSEEDVREYKRAWAQPGAMTGMINWYRALLRRAFAFGAETIEVPTLILWGKWDAFLIPALAPASVRRCRRATLLWFDEATHWVHLEEAAAVNAAILQVLKSDSKNQV